MAIEATLQLAIQHHQAGRLGEAEKHYRQVLAQSPDHVKALNQLGVLMGQTAKLDDAIVLLQRAVQLDPDFAQAHSNLGKALAEADRPEEAIAACQRAIQLRPDYSKAYYNLGVALVPTGRIDEAQEAFGRAAELKSDYANAHYNLGLARLLLGNLKGGWREYEWRWQASGLPKPRRFNRPQWTGSPIRRGETMLIHPEQGFGDTLQFIRFAPLVATRGAKIIFESPPELARLLEASASDLLITQVIQSSTPPALLPPFDLHCPVMSLPLAFGTDTATIPAATYLKPPPILIERWKNRLKSDDTNSPRIGIVWAGRPTHRNDRNRSIDLSTLATHLSSIPGVAFYSLQMGDAARQLAGANLKLIDHTALLTDFAETAALIANLDLIITVDTAVAHLAGAMSKPVWVLLPFVPDWRWMLNRDDSPWYPTMRLFRQQQIGDWSAALQMLADQLRIFSVSWAPLQ